MTGQGQNYRRRSPWRTAAALVLLLIVAAIFYISRPLDRIAVVPAQWLTGGGDKLEETLSEDVTTELAKRRDVRVVAWPSILRYRGEHKDIHRIAAELEAGKSLIVGVTGEGKWSRVTLSFLDPALDRKLWVTEYFRKDLTTAEAQREMARRVANSFEANQKKQERE